MSRPTMGWTRSAGQLLAYLTLLPVAAPAQEARPIPLAELAAPGLSPSDLRLIAALRDYIPHVLRQNGTPGLNLAVARHHQIIWRAGFGYADLERKTPMTPRTVFHSGSMGKTYTATAVMQLVEQGVMELDQPVNRYLKDFQIKDPLGDREVTLRDLLTHRSGLTGNAAGSDYLPPQPLAQHVKETYGRTAFREYSGAIPLWSAKVC